jgi:hypothetical protein
MGMLYRKNQDPLSSKTSRIIAVVKLIVIRGWLLASQAACLAAGNKKNWQEIAITLKRRFVSIKIKPYSKIGTGTVLSGGFS